jgi:hypothetical protein
MIDEIDISIPIEGIQLIVYVSDDVLDTDDSSLADVDALLSEGGVL